MHTNQRFLALPDFPLGNIAWVQEDLESRGIDVINLGAGDADLGPPPTVVERICQAVRDVSYS